MRKAIWYPAKYTDGDATALLLRLQCPLSSTNLRSSDLEIAKRGSADVKPKGGGREQSKLSGKVFWLHAPHEQPVVFLSFLPSLLPSFLCAQVGFSQEREKVKFTLLELRSADVWRGPCRL